MTDVNRKYFSAEFKREAVRLLEQGEKGPAQLARELGIRTNQLYKWKARIKQFGESAFPGSGAPHQPVNNSVALRAENFLLKEEIAILKKAAIFYARMPR